MLPSPFGGRFQGGRAGGTKFPSGCFKKMVQKNTFFLTAGAGGVDLAAMNATTTSKTRWCWRKDLAGFRGLSDRERAGFLLVLEWAVSARATPGQV